MRNRGDRKRALGTRALMAIPQELNQRWSLNFVSDSLACGHPGFALLDLEPPHLLSGRRVGRAAVKCGKARDVADVVALRRVRETAHVHVFDQPLAQRARRDRKGCGHSSAPWLKEP